jgi:hypothetical protein
VNGLDGLAMGFFFLVQGTLESPRFDGLPPVTTGKTTWKPGPQTAMLMDGMTSAENR